MHLERDEPNLSQRHPSEESGLFRSIFAQAAVGIAQTSLTGDWLRINDRLCAILGYTQSDLRRRAWLDVTHPDEREACLDATRQLLSGEIPLWSAEQRYICKDGTVIWGRIFISLVRDEEDRPQYFIVIIDDVTDRIQSERVLGETQQQLRLALSAGLGVWEYDLRSGSAALSPQYRKVFGHAPLTYGEWMKLIHPDDRERVVAIAREGVERTHPWEAEFRVLWPDGSIRWMLSKAAILLDDDRKPSRMVGISLDITERKRNEEQRLHLAGLVESSEIAIVGKNVDGTIVSWNCGAENLYGYSAEEMLGKHISVLVPADRRQSIAPVLEKLRRGERIERLEAQRVRKDGRIVTVLLTLSPIRDASDAVVGISGIALDITDRKKADAALKEAEERLRFAQEAASIGTFDRNLKTGMSAWTPELEAMHGLETGSFPGTHGAWERLLHPDDRARVVERVTESMKTGEPAEGEWRVIWPDGTIRWLAGRWQVFKNDRGDPVRMMGVNFDVTNRKHMEEALRQSEERFRLAFKATNDAVWDIDLTTGTVSWNDTYAMLYGRPPETSDSWDWWIERIHPDDRERTVEGLRNAIHDADSSWTCEYRFRRADLSWAHIYDRCFISRNAAGEAERVIGAMQDVTARRRGEIALRDSEERFRKVFEEGPLGLALVGRDFRFLKVNRALCEMVEYPETELIQMSFADITYPDDLDADLALAARLFSGELPFYRLQKRYVKKTGEIIWINLTASIIRNQEGEPIHGLAMVEDITEVKRTQEEAFTRQKLESVGLLASGIAHDFNNLLGGVLAEAEVAETELEAGESPLESIRRIRTVALRGAEIVRELMIYSGQDSEDPVQPIDFSRLVQEMLELLRVSISKHAALEVDLPTDLPAVIGWPSQLRQIVMNLIINASEAIGDRPGSIRVATSLVALPGKSASSRPVSAEYLKLKISDTGVGMTEDVRAKVFDPFFSTKFSGRGMGLAVVQRIVRDYEGFINVESTPGKGTVFEILLPRVRGTSRSKRANPRTTVKRHGTPPATILVVEDEEALLTAISKLLRRNGLNVIEARDGSAALDAIRNNQTIDIMLLDVTLPGVSGREVFDEAQRVRSALKVILTSAYSKETVQALFSGAQIKQFIRKPFQFVDLIGLVEHTLEV